MSRVVWAIAVLLSLFHLYTAAFGVLAPPLQRGVHLAGILALAFLLPTGDVKRGRLRLTLDIVFAVLSVWIGMFLAWNWTDLETRVGNYNILDSLTAAAAVLVSLEAARRLMGRPMVIVCGVILGYGLWGNWVPGTLGHKGFTWRQIVEHSYWSGEGLTGIPIGVSSTFVFIFILLSAILNVSGIGQYLIDLTLGMVGRRRGGAAHASILASSLFGMISGSSTANALTTGTFTVPLMKSAGYPSRIAGAVEAVASSGGQLMPPVMGASAFIMAEFLGVSYFRIALAAAVPAVLLYAHLWLSVTYETRHLGLSAIATERLPKFRSLVTRLYFLIPFVSVVYFLFTGSSPMQVGYYTILTTLVILLPTKANLRGLRDLVSALEDGARSAVPIGVACAAAGVIVGVISLTGLGLKLANSFYELSFGNVWAALVLTAIASIVLGTALPTTATYIVLASTVAPGLALFGIPPIAAHLFIFYYGVLGDLTPPEMITVYVSAGLAKADPMEVAVDALRLGLSGFVVPFAFAVNPELLLLSHSIPQALQAAMMIGVSALGLSAGCVGYWRRRLHPVERIVLLLCAAIRRRRPTREEEP